MLGRWLARALVAGGARHERRGDLVRACRRYRAATRAAPHYAPAWLNLGGALEAAGDAAQAERAYDALRAADPRNPFALYNLARLRHARGELAEAGPMLQEALSVRPDFPDALVVLAAVQEGLGAPEEAAASLERALALRPGHAGIWLNYADLAWRIRRPEAAERALRRVLETAPEEAFASFQVARLEHSRGRLAEAQALLATAVRARPDFAEAWILSSGVLRSLDRMDEAEDAARQAIAAAPESPEAHYSLGLVLRAVSRLDEACAAFAAAARLAPGRLDLEPAELLTLMLADSLSAEALFARHRAYGERVEAAVAPRYREFRGAREPDRRLRIGFLSCDFNRHPVAWFVQPLFESLDRARVEVRCYSVGERADETTAQVRGAADAWTEAAALGDEALADAIHADGIDILVDLIGHAGSARMGVFARRPAPVQASWLGYLGTTGMTRIHYRITDSRADPPGAAESFHTERLARLPHAQWCFRPPYAAEHAPEPPCRRNGFVTFGSFNHAPKLSGRVRRLWVEILRAAPATRLLLVGVPEGRAHEALLEQFVAAGIAAERLTIRPRVSLDEFLQKLGEVDVALDTVPYGGGTTTFDALWMGVPVVTLAGERSAGRSAASILGTLAMDDWIAQDDAAYVRLAVDCAADPGRLAELRPALRARLRASPLMDEPAFARDMEALLRRLWREWCAGRIT